MNTIAASSEHWPEKTTPLYYLPLSPLHYRQVPLNVTYAEDDTALTISDNLSKID